LPEATPLASKKFLVTLMALLALTCLRGPASAGAADIAPFRGASLNSPSSRLWPWEDWDSANKAQVEAYLDRLAALHVNAIRTLIFAIDWSNPAYQHALLEYIDAAAARRMKILFWLAFDVPSGHSNPKYRSFVDRAKLMVDRTVGHVATGRPRTPTILGWTVGNGEDPWSLSVVDFMEEIIPYVRTVDPYHPIGAETYNTWSGIYDGQLLGLESSNGHVEVRRRSWYGHVDYIGVSNYDFHDGQSRMPFNAATLLTQVNRQNSRNKPVVIEEYGNRLNDDPRASLLTQLVNTAAGRATNVQGTFLWNGHPEWNDAFLRPPGTNNLGIFWGDPGLPYELGLTKGFARVWGDRHGTRPWATYNFDDITSRSQALDGEDRADLALHGDAHKGPGRTGKGLVLDGPGDYATKAYDPADSAFMDSPFLSFEAWIKPMTWKWSNGLASRDGVWSVFLDGDGKLRAWANTGSGWSGKGASASTVPVDAWTHVAVRFDGSGWRYYINGRLDATFADVGALPSGVVTPFHLGTNGPGTPYASDHFQGTIDEVQIGAISPPLVRLSADEGIGSVLLDSSPHGSHAMLFGGYSWARQMVGDGRSIQFNGVDAYATIPNSSTYQLRHFTVDFYMRANDASSSRDQYIIGQGRGCCGSGWSLYLRGGRLNFVVNTDNVEGASEMRVSVPYEDIAWHHVRARHDGVTATLSVDGVPTSVPARGGIAYRYNEDVTLGRHDRSPFHYFGGALDEVEIYSTPW
jgi:Concanavalin A-like lectin/glucanases superfamily